MVIGSHSLPRFPMSDFELPVTYQNQELIFPARLLLQGYQPYFEVTVREIPVRFERDEEERFRALVSSDQLDHRPQLELPLLEAIAHVLEVITGREEV
jgi:hypothetical protein